ncbi:MAG: hypothetical protein M3003_08145 [Candidatus Dormibacteraeota bacterium]|nr:hypothetical protein [Candidatus Dormibacteraeota bacterium]
MLTRPAGARGLYVREAVLGSWARTGLAAALVLVILGGIAVLGATGRLGDLRYANIPVIHPWPPAGYYQNPFNPTDRGDLVNASDAAKVKGDLVADGQVELRAYQTSDGSLLQGADTGNRLAKLRSALDQNHAAGVFEDFKNQLTTVRVGKLVDPNDSSVTWCVEEIGTSRITLTKAADGSVLQQFSISFDDKFWMKSVGGRYLIADAEVHSVTTSS